MAKKTRFLSDGQCVRAAVLGLDISSAGGLKALAANTSTKIWDEDEDQRRPVLIRIQNISASPLSWSEGQGKCDADVLNGVLPADSLGGAAPAGDGGGIEFQRHIPRDVYVHSVAAVNILVTLRYAE